MAFGFAGAHRTGKTTLAKLVAEDLKMTYHDASVSKIMKEAGINAVGDVPLQARIEAQEFLLKRYLKDLQWAPRPLVTDRTPLDMIGYALGELTMHNTDAALGRRFDDFCDACIGATVQHFDTIVVVRPLTTYTADPSKPPHNLGYQTMVQLLIEGAATFAEGNVYVHRLYTSDLQDRRLQTNAWLSDRMSNIVEMSKQVRKH